MRSTRYGGEFIATVLESRPLTPTTHGIRVTRDPDFDFEPVQFTFLSLRTDEDPDFEDYRPMSLASSPARPYLEYGVRVSDSAWKRAFVALEPGDEVMVEGAVGDFILEPDRPAAFLAGGIGVTPLKGMAEYAADKRLDIPVRLVYSNRDQSEIAYREELEALAGQNPRFTIEHTLTREPADSGWEGRRGRIDRGLLERLERERPGAVYYICGAPGMVEDLVHALSDMGVGRERVRFEEFWGYD